MENTLFANVAVINVLIQTAFVHRTATLRVCSHASSSARLQLGTVML